jgi:hypothetical protein
MLFDTTFFKTVYARVIRGLYKGYTNKGKTGVIRLFIGKIPGKLQFVGGFRGFNYLQNKKILKIFKFLKF